jgi:hypothetical protein
MPDKRDLTELLHSTLTRAQYAGWRTMFSGRLTPTGVTLAGASEGKCWVRSHETSYEETQVWGSVTRVNVPVYVGPNLKGELEIKDVNRELAAYSIGAGAAATILPPVTPENNPNLLISGRQFKPGRMRLSELGGLNVYVEPFFYDGGFWGGGNLPLTPPATANQQAWCAVALNPATNTLTQFTGAGWPVTVAPPEADLGNLSISAGLIPVGAVVLKNGQTTLTGAEAWSDFRYHLGERKGGPVDWYEPRVAPTNPTDVDDEFVDASLNGAWTWSVSPASTSVTSLASWLVVTLAANNTHQLRRAFAPGADTEFGIEVMLSFPGSEEGDTLGVALLDSSDARIAALSLAYENEQFVFVSVAPNTPVFANSGPELIVNGGAEAALGSEWQVSNMVRATNYPYSGSYCIKGIQASYGGPAYTRYAKQTINLTTLGTYKLSFAARLCDNDTSGSRTHSRIAAKFTDPTGNPHFDYSLGDREWPWQVVSTSVQVDEPGDWTFWFSAWSNNEWGYPGEGAVDLVSLSLNAPRPAPSVNMGWLRIHRSAANVYRFYYSSDGITWRLKYVSDAVSTAVAKLALEFGQSSTTPRAYAVNYVRRYV